MDKTSAQSTIGLPGSDTDVVVIDGTNIRLLGNQSISELSQPEYLEVFSHLKKDRVYTIIDNPLHGRHDMTAAEFYSSGTKKRQIKFMNGKILHEILYDDKHIYEGFMIDDRIYAINIYDRGCIHKAKTYIYNSLTKKLELDTDTYLPRCDPGHVCIDHLNQGPVEPNPPITKVEFAFVSSLLKPDSPLDVKFEYII